MASVTINCGTAQDRYFQGGSTWATPALRFGSSFSYVIPFQALMAQVTITVQQPAGVSLTPNWSFQVTGLGIEAPFTVDVTTPSAVFVFIANVQPDGCVHLQFTSLQRNALVSTITVNDIPGMGFQSPVLAVAPPAAPGPGPTGFTAMALDANGFLYVSTPIGQPGAAVKPRWFRFGPGQAIW